MEKMQDAAVPSPLVPIPALENNRVLLVDANPAMRKLRLASMTRVGISVCCASDAAQARMLLRESTYDLVLIDLPRDRQAALKLRDDLKEDRPEQPIRFFVGKPSYLALGPLPEHLSARSAPLDPKKRLHALIAKNCDETPGRGRLLEAAWRITALRRERTSPADSEGAVGEHSFADAVRQAEKNTLAAEGTAGG